MATMTSEELDRNPGGAIQAADREPVFIMEAGKPTYVLMTMADYKRVSETREINPDASRTDGTI